MTATTSVICSRQPLRYHNLAMDAAATQSAPSVIFVGQAGEPLSLPTLQLHQCPTCSQVFRTSKELVSHYQRWHGKLCFRCERDGCTALFKSAATRNLHYLRRHADDPRAHACKLCPFACALRGDFNQHMRRTHPQGAPPVRPRQAGRRVPGVFITPLADAVKRRAADAAAPPRKRSQIDHIDVAVPPQLTSYDVSWVGDDGDDNCELDLTLVEDLTILGLPPGSP